MKILWVKKNDIPTLTSISGNIDADALTPHIYTAQRTQLKRILGPKLYDYIDERIQTNQELTGDYKMIFDTYIVDMVIYFSAMNFMKFGGYKVGNNGFSKPVSEGGIAVDKKEVVGLIEGYLQLGTSCEGQFKDAMKTITIPEYDACFGDKTTNVIGWF